MRKTLILLPIAIGMCCSCSIKNVETISSDTTEAPDSTVVTGFDENNYESFLDLDNYKTGSAPAAAELQLIDSSAVIVINPTDEQIKEMEEKYDEDFYSIADDNSFYQAEAMSRLDSLGVKTVPAEKRYLKLQGKNNHWILDIRKEGAPEWNMILFSVGKTPEIVSSIDVTNEKIKEFFQL